MNVEEVKFLNEVYSRSKDPAVMRKIINAAILGLESHAERTRLHAVDMEVVANMAMNTRLFKNNERFIADKLEKWKSMNGLRWDDQIAELRERAK